MQSNQLMDDDFDNFYPDSEAGRDTQTSRKRQDELRLAEAVRPLLRDIFTRIRQAAERREGKLEHPFSPECLADVQSAGMM